MLLLSPVPTLLLIQSNSREKHTHGGHADHSQPYLRQLLGSEPRIARRIATKVYRINPHAWERRFV